MGEPNFGTVCRDLALSLGFFTRLPLGRRRIDGDFVEALWAAPVVGAGIGLLVGLSLILTVNSGITAPAAAAIAMGFGILLTGALHEDGLADVADGFGGGRDSASKLAIMRDSRVGTFGVLAVVLSLLLRWSSLTVVALEPWSQTLVICVAAHAASRALLPFFIHVTPPARAEGLGAGVKTISLKAVLVAMVIGVIALAGLGLSIAIPTIILLALVCLVFSYLCRRQIGGQTGDVLGALQQSAEVIVFVIATATFESK